MQIIRDKGRGSDDSVSNISSRDRNGLLLRCLHPSLDHEFMPFWQQLSTTNITILCLSFKVKYSAAFKCNAGAPTGPELSIRQLELERRIFQLFQQKIRQTLFKWPSSSRVLLDWPLVCSQLWEVQWTQILCRYCVDIAQIMQIRVHTYLSAKQACRS